MAGVRRFDEQRALETALEVFWDKGFRATSMLDLAERTGVQRGSLYHAYGGKEEIFLRVFEQFAGEFLTDARRTLAMPDKRAAFTAFFDFCIQSITAGSPSRGCLSTRTALDADTGTPRVQAAVRKLLDDLEEAVFTALSDSPVDARQSARVVIAMTRGLAVLERVYQDPERLRDTANALIASLLPE
jgi:AcrR family transcriptional regulator